MAKAPVAAAAPYLVDGDGDGVSDEIDDCPYTHPGVQVNALGCPIRLSDGDLDGVPDEDDDCPYSAPGAIVDARGCALDGDFDGVANGIDRCPNTGLSLPVDTKGCAKGEQPVAVAQAKPPKLAAAGGEPAKQPRALSRPLVAAAPPPVITLPAQAAMPAASETPVIAKPATISRSPAVIAEPAPIAASGVAVLGAESPVAKLRFAQNSDRLNRADLALLQGYAKIFARRLGADAALRLHLGAYADHRESDVAAIVAARVSVVRSALLAQGIAANRLVAESGVLRDGKAVDNRRVEIKLGE